MLLASLLTTPLRLPPLRPLRRASAVHASGALPCCEPGGPLCPTEAPQRTVAVSEATRLLLRVPEDDAVVEDYIGQAHQVALAADDYDAAMMAHCQRAIADEPAYWAQLWPSALALSRRLLERPELVAGRAVVEIGSGLGLASLAAAHAGAASVLATDREPRALAFAAQSAADGGFELATASLDWLDLDAWAAGSAETLLCADVLYGDTAAAELAPLLDHLVPAGGTALVADNADRPYGDRQ
jgi:predicted nicotinamide N-methyase